MFEPFAKDRIIARDLPEPSQKVEVWTPPQAASGAHRDAHSVEWSQRQRYAPFVDAARDRRRFLKLMAASMAAAGVATRLTACVESPTEAIVPYVDEPEGFLPGVPRYYATTITRNGYGYGALVESHFGRPTKIEGNPRHPASLGASDVYMQAELFSLYDPDRSRTITTQNRVRTEGELSAALAAKAQEWAKTSGAGLRILTGEITSPSLAAEIDKTLKRYPRAVWHQWQPVNDDAALAGGRIAFGEDVAARYHLERAEVILQLDGDLFSDEPGSLAYARAIARRRAPGANMSRLYAAESVPGLFGAYADHRLGINGILITELAHCLVTEISSTNAAARDFPSPGVTAAQRDWIGGCARDLKAHPGRSLIVPGRNQSARVHALCHWLNHELGNAGRTVTYHRRVGARSELLGESIASLAVAMTAGDVESLLLLDTNPVFDAPADLGFAEGLGKVAFSAHLGLYRDETAALTDWHIPLHHALESWGDARAHEGSCSLLQPLITPLYQSLSAQALLTYTRGERWRGDFECLQQYWRSRFNEGDFAARWRRSLIEGVIEATGNDTVTPRLNPDLLAKLPPRQSDAAGGTMLQFCADARLWDGRYANNGWLQELPHPLTKVTWGNAALIGNGFAARHSLREGDVIAIEYRQRRVEIPVYPLSGHPDDAVTLPMGHGRNILGGDNTDAIGANIGVDVYPLRHLAGLSFAPGAQITKTEQRVTLARTQHEDHQHRRHPVEHANLEHWLKHPRFIAANSELHDPNRSLYPEPAPENFAEQQYAWGMSIDLNACIGCGACSIACQAENNIPVVGREEVLNGREMHWLRIDRYHAPEPDDTSATDTPHGPRTFFQPMLCQHCENAPCEYVCPVGATVHDAEGLNVMVYNRCIGTRDCSQNCPYKVRRFNFRDYTYNTPYTEALAPARNPDVTVRSRGVMEKCTYCLQRISRARREAKKQARVIRDGEVQSACQQACPTQAIVFGNLNDESSSVSRHKRHPLSYTVLAPLNTRPRTTYLARVANLNPSMAAHSAAAEPEES